MKVLGFDTTTELLTMAVVEDERLMGELTVRDARGPTEHLVGLLKRFLEHLGLTLRDVDALAVGIGPGSWTGTRVGVITGKVLAFATGKPISGVSSFDAMVYGCGVQDGTVCVLSDFGRERVFSATYEVHDGAYGQVTDYAAVPLEESLKGIDRRTTFIGQGALRHREALSAVHGSTLLPQVASPSGRCIASLGLRSLLEGEDGNPDALVPLYVALPQAEVAAQSKGL
jgi:tRNA threonylcarbamoyladenosine biosynthesis protein TsaB